MARRVFFSFKYEDVTRAMVVRNSWVTQGIEAAGFVDKAEFEEVKRKGDQSIKNWIDKQLDGTSVTVILVGANTSKSRWVKCEIEKSIERGNGLLSIDISKIKDLQGNTGELVVRCLQVIHFIFGLKKMDSTIWAIGLKKLHKRQGNNSCHPPKSSLPT
jgi:hypothetical protein